MKKILLLLFSCASLFAGTVTNYYDSLQLKVYPKFATYQFFTQGELKLTIFSHKEDIYEVTLNDKVYIKSFTVDCHSNYKYEIGGAALTNYTPSKVIVVIKYKKYNL